ncbi:hypothetical protein LTR37_001536 [Vermiconidia calcicola]|uniref:Uncharacterized protein n=1 Tax=Vermiconidia calcicola TaxID=1690605 RepID=A0ACC3NWH5_9PEZI|nr:hypothetical protein LTR37_001536 [Vermiconidia calcicola]
MLDPQQPAADLLAELNLQIDVLPPPFNDMASSAPDALDIHRFPREIRDILYFFAVVPPTPIELFAIRTRNGRASDHDRLSNVWHIKPARSSALHTFASICRTSRQVREEASKIFYLHARLDVRPAFTQKAYLPADKRLGPMGTAFQRFAHITLTRESEINVCKFSAFKKVAVAHRVAFSKVASTSERTAKWNLDYSDGHEVHKTVEVLEHFELVQERLTTIATRMLATMVFNELLLWKVLDLMLAPAKLDVVCEAFIMCGTGRDIATHDV